MMISTGQDLQVLTHKFKYKRLTYE